MRKEGEDDGAMLPGQAVGVGRTVRAGALLVLRFPLLQTPPRQRHRGRGAEAGTSMAEEPDGHRFVQVRLRSQISVQRFAAVVPASCP